MTKQELVQELRFAIPSQILCVVKNGAIRVYGEKIFLKQRDPSSDDDWIMLEERKGPHHDYSELSGKNVVFAHSLFNKRGQEFIAKYAASEL